MADQTPHARPDGAAPHPSPRTDPTNPLRQESTGEWVPAEDSTERRNDEPGLTDADRQDRDPS